MGLVFAVPPKHPFNRTNLGHLLKSNPSLTDDTEQVQGYCSTWSVPYAVLTNGKQLLMFSSFRFDGVPLRSGDVFVISDLFSGYNYSVRIAVRCQE
jgi:hypothetical protein